MLSALLWMFLALYVALRLPVWLERWSLFQALLNWWHYGCWNACRHQGLTEVRTPVEMGGVSAIAEYVCNTCGLALMKHTMPQLAPPSPATMQQAIAQATRAVRWAERREMLRCWLGRWGAPLVQEYACFCRFVGGLLVTASLLLWLCWGTLGEPLLTAILGPASCRQIRLEMFVLEANKMPACWSSSPNAMVYQEGLPIVVP